MRVRLLTGICGDGISHQVGDLLELPDDVAEAWIADRQAEAERGESDVRPVEAAMKPRARAR